MLPIVKQFDPLTRDQIRAIRPGMWGDSELLDALKYFETERKDRDRAMAVAELILRSPQVSDVDYGWLCLDLMGYCRWKRNFPAALRWAHVLIAHLFRMFCSILPRSNSRREDAPWSMIPTSWITKSFAPSAAP